jgi:DNA recombination protein RmuC
MDTTGQAISIISCLALIVVITFIVILFFQIRKMQGGSGDLSPVLQNMTQSLQQEQTQVAVLNEKLTHIEPIIQTTSDLLVDIRGLGERVSKVESNQEMVNQGVGYLTNNALSTFSELKTLTNGLAEATSSMREELTRAKNDLTELHTHAKNEQETERQIAESIRRLETIIAGTQSKGSAGENILEVVFAKLPIEWQVRDFKVGGKSVEFALKLPNNLIMPIDSKWTATNLLEQFVATDDIIEQQRLKGLIEDAVLQKAKEVKKYIDPSVTVNFGVAVIPDAIYDLCAGIQYEIFQLNIVLVSYSMFIPYLLLVFQTVLKTSQSIDLHKLDAYLQTAQDNVKALQDELDGRFSRAVTMLDNSRTDMHAYLSKIGGSLTGLQLGAGTVNPSLPEPQTPELEPGDSSNPKLFQ